MDGQHYHQQQSATSAYIALADDDLTTFNLAVQYEIPDSIKHKSNCLRHHMPEGSAGLTYGS